MNKPENCDEKCCECIINIQDVFCIGKTHVSKFFVDGKWHRNDHHFCIMSLAQGTHQYMINEGDMDLLMKLFMTARSRTKDEFNLRWYFSESHNFSLSDSIVLQLERKENE